MLKHRSGYYAFHPKPIPHSIQFEQLVPALSRADQLVGELSGLGRYLPNPMLLIRPYVNREAVASAKIEETVQISQTSFCLHSIPVRPASKSMSVKSKIM